MTERLGDWWERLQATVREWEAKPFKYGETDCAMFAAACVFAVRGVDVAATWRGIYHDRLTSFARLNFRKHSTLASAAETELTRIGAIEIDPRAARCGDIGVDHDDMLAVRMPPGFVARRLRGGFGIVRVQKAWAV